MQNNSQKTGRAGEAVAKQYLTERGYTILETNWRYRKLEVDIIASHMGLIVFVEVKARSNNNYGEPEEFVGTKKQRFLVEAAHQYLVEKELDQEARFDIISVTGHNNNTTVKHFQGAFYPSVN